MFKATGLMLGPIRFWEGPSELRLGRYGLPPRNLAIWLMTEDCQLIATATVNYSDALPLDRFWIKTWSENEGILEAMERAGFVRREGLFRRYPAGHQAVLCIAEGKLAQAVAEFRQELAPN